MALSQPWKYFNQNLEVQSSIYQGEGSFGKVWKVRDKDKHSMFAIKQIDIANTLKYFLKSIPDEVHDKLLEAYKKLLREVEHLNELYHENVVKYYEYWLEGSNELVCNGSSEEFTQIYSNNFTLTTNAFEYMFIKMEFCVGNLKEYLKTTPLENRNDNILNLLLNLSNGLEAIHDQKIIHRDIKPGNIFYSITNTNDNHVNYSWKIGDFGLSIKQNVETTGSEKSFAGTELYQSPEMINKNPYDSKTDVYSMGLVFLEILASFTINETTDEKSALYWSLKHCSYLSSSVKSVISGEREKEAKIVEYMLQFDTDYRITSSVVKQLIDGTKTLESLHDLSHSNAASEVPELDLPIWFDVSDVSPNFVGRQIELDRLRQIYCDKRQSLVVVSGLGGIGKSELVRKFAINVFEKFKCSCVWINGENDETVFKSFTGLCSEFNLPLNSSSGQSNIKSLKPALEKLHKSLKGMPLLFMIDNVDEIDEGVSILLSMLKNLPLPRPLTAVTTRKVNLLNTPVEDGIILKVLLPAEAELFVEKSLALKDAVGAANLAKTLEYFPLALQQAVSYIKQKAIQMNFNIADYIEVYQKRKNELLNIELDMTEHEYAKTTLTTWEITMSAIQSVADAGPLANEFLNILAYWARPDGTRVQFLNEAFNDVQKFQYSSDGQPICITDELTTEATKLLTDYSMCTNESRRYWRKHSNYISTHRLVQEVVRLRDGAAKDMERMRRILDNLLSHDVLWFDNQSGNVEWKEYVHNLWMRSLDYTEVILEYKELFYKLLVNGFGTRNQTLLRKTFDIFTVTLGPKEQSTMVIEQQLLECLEDDSDYITTRELVLKCRDLYKREKEVLGAFAILTTRMLKHFDFTSICEWLSNDDDTVLVSQLPLFVEELFYDYLGTFTGKKLMEIAFVLITLLQYHKKHPNSEPLERIFGKLLEHLWNPNGSNVKEHILLLAWFVVDTVYEVGELPIYEDMKFKINQVMCHPTELSSAICILLKEFSTSDKIRKTTQFLTSSMQAMLSLNVDYNFIRATIRSLADKEHFEEMKTFQTKLSQRNSSDNVDSFCFVHLLKQNISEPVVTPDGFCADIKTKESLIYSVLELTRHITSADMKDFDEAMRLRNVLQAQTHKFTSTHDSGFGSSIASQNKKSYLKRDVVLESLKFSWIYKSHGNNLSIADICVLMRKATAFASTDLAKSILNDYLEDGLPINIVLWCMREIIKCLWHACFYEMALFTINLVSGVFEEMDDVEQENVNTCIRTALNSMAIETCYRDFLPEFYKKTLPETPNKFKVKLLTTSLKYKFVHMPLLQLICDENGKALKLLCESIIKNQSKEFEIEIGIAVQQLILSVWKVSSSPEPSFDLVKLAMGLPNDIKSADVFKHAIEKGVENAPECISVPIASSLFFHVFCLTEEMLSESKGHTLLLLILKFLAKNNQCAQIIKFQTEITDAGFKANVSRRAGQVKIPALSLWIRKEIAKCLLSLGKDANALWIINSFAYLPYRMALSFLVFNTKPETEQDHILETCNEAITEIQKLDSMQNDCKTTVEK